MGSMNEVILPNAISNLLKSKDLDGRLTECDGRQYIDVYQYGQYVCRVTVGISCLDLSEMLRVAQAHAAIGYKQGMSAKAREIRDALGII